MPVRQFRMQLMLSIISRVGVVSAVTSIAGTAEITQNTHVEFSIVLWVVGGMLALISILLAVIGYFIKDMRDNNIALENRCSKLSGELNFLTGQHTYAYDLKGCAFDHDRLKTIVKTIVDEYNSRE